MIITREHAEKLIRLGKARQVSIVLHNGHEFWAIDRLDKIRVDHYLINRRL